MLGCFPFVFGVLCSQWFPPCFNTPRLPVASNRRLHNLAAPRTGRIGHCLKKVAAAESGVFGNPPSGWSSPFRGSCWGFLGGFDFWALLGCVWPACPMCIRILWGWNIRAVRRGGVPAVRGRRTLVFSMARVFCCARLTLVFGTARWRMSLSPRDRQTGSCWS